MEKRLGIPSVELTRLYQVAQIHKQYQALAQVLGTEIDDSSWHERAQAVVGKMREKYSGRLSPSARCRTAMPLRWP